MRRVLAAVVFGCFVLALQAGRVEAAAPAEAPVAADQSDAGYLPYSEPRPLEGISVWGTFARSVVALGIVLALMGGAIVLARRYVPGAGGSEAGGTVRVLGRVTLAPKQTVYFLQVPGRVLIVGSGGGQLSALGEVTDADEIAELLHTAPGLSALPGAAFGGLLQRRLEQAGAAARRASIGPEDTALDAIRRQIAHLRALARPESK